MIVLSKYIFPKSIDAMGSALVFCCIMLFLPALSSANPQNLQILGVSSTNPVPGTTMSVTVRFCDDTGWANNRVRIMAGFVAGGGVANFSNCPSAGQYMFVSSGISGHVATGPGMYDTTSGSTGVNDVYPGYTNNGTPSCPAQSVTAIWSVYIDGNYLSAGTYSLVVGASEDYLGCTGGTAYDSINVDIPYPPANITLSKTAEGNTATSNGLILFRMDYNYVNTGDLKSVV
jgi:hypothetical protein